MKIGESRSLATICLHYPCNLLLCRATFVDCVHGRFFVGHALRNFKILSKAETIGGSWIRRLIRRNVRLVTFSEPFWFSRRWKRFFLRHCPYLTITCAMPTPGRRV